MSSFYDMDKKVYKDWSPEKIEQQAKKYSKLKRSELNKKLKTIEYEMKEVNYCLNKTQDDGKIKSVIKTALVVLSIGFPIPRSAEPKYRLQAIKKGYEIQQKIFKRALELKDKESKNESFFFESYNIDDEIDLMLENTIYDILKKK